MTGSPAENLNKEVSELRKKVNGLSEVVVEMVDPVHNALKEIHSSRQSRTISTVAIIVMLLLNGVGLYYNISQIKRMSEATDVLEAEQLSHRISSGLTAAQVQQLIELAKQQARTPEMKKQLEQVERYKSDNPPPKALQEAQKAAQGSVPSKVIERVLKSTDAK